MTLLDSQIARTLTTIASEYHAMRDGGMSAESAREATRTRLRGIVETNFLEFLDRQKYRAIRRQIAWSQVLPVLQDMADEALLELI